MIVSIMQPYFFPYVGYFQLMSACDIFVIRDDAQYIKGGWVNRNRILVHSEPQWITFPVAHADYHFSINRREYLMEAGVGPARILRKVAGAYRHAPQFKTTMPLLEEIMAFSNANVAAFNANLLRKTAGFLGILTPVIVSSALPKDNSCTGPAMVVEICERLGASHYLNPVGGRDLYDSRLFHANALTLSFMKPVLDSYPQFGLPHVASLSIIDVLMFNEMTKVDKMLNTYRLITTRLDICSVDD